MKTYLNIGPSLLLVFVLMFMTACVSAPDGVNGVRRNPASDAKVKIGFAMDTLKEERWNKDFEAFKQHCEEVGADCQITVANSSGEKQLADVEQLLTSGIEVLVLAPHDAIQAAQIVDKAKAHGVPVISYDRLVNSEKVDLYISHQISVVGRAIAEYAVERVPKGKYVLVCGSTTDNNAKIIKEEQMKVLQPSIDRGDIKIVAEQFINDWSPDLAMSFAENALTQNRDDVQVFLVSNDGMASGVVQALEKKGLSGKVLVTGQDAQLNALQSIAEGRQSMTVYKPIVPLAKGAVDAAMKLARGGNIENAEPYTFSIDGKPYTVRALLLQVFPVDRSNLVSTVMKDGYASFADVFKNVPQEKRPSQ